MVNKRGSNVNILINIKKKISSLQYFCLQIELYINLYISIYILTLNINN